jgi:predicted dehydrogenase
MKKLIKFGVVGAGRIGKRHSLMIQRNENAELLAVCDIRPDVMVGFSGDEAPVYEKIDDMLKAHPEIEVLVVASPNGLHADQAIQALKAGKHVVIEKPMCLNTSEGERIIHTALHESRQVFVVKQNRYSPPVKWLKSVIDSGVLGKIYMVHMDCFWNRDERYYTGADWHGGPLDGGSLFTQFSHFIDILYWTLGDIENIHARMTNFNHEELTPFPDSGMIHFDLKRGGQGSLNFSTSCYDRNLESSVTIIAEKGTVKIGGQYMDEVLECHIQDYEMPDLPDSEPPNDYGPYKGSAANHRFVVQNVVETLQGHSSAKTSAMEGLKVVDMIERIYRAASAETK